ncbi:MAG: 3-hydroxyacyl-ACP dehydratase FabZ [Deltaproteobacteria bacterium]|jgi:3-hydroxyacyl-[acyl-carrier-protein] dehydratase|nr:3-hydroxyacyl-ACP dehydratase FabZ [Deltaproteobacteria bacterium]
MTQNEPDGVKKFSQGEFDIRKIMEALPHRYPFLLVDRVVDMLPGETLKCYKNVTINEPFFQGHFPGIPVMPGVLIIEAMAQAGGILILSSSSVDLSKKPIFLFTGIEKVRFRKQVIPGDRLDLEGRLLRKKMRIWKMSCQAMVDGALVAEAELSGALLYEGEM